ncbi:hypothetical protein AYO48_00045 [Gaiella sp. SCGC AG-212-M14]|nr:hypothetical protein AYO48_00045 [Gaiella sp. SCGC AG-212-M14]
MARSRQTPEPEGHPLLTVPREQFEGELDERIEGGRELRDREIQDDFDDLAAAQSDYYTWSEYNAEFLKRRFTTPKVADEYSAFYGGFVGGGPRSLEMRVREYRGNVQDMLRRLDSVKQRIPLFEESPHVHASREPEAKKDARKKAAIESIFIVHGHDDALKLAVHGFVREITEVEVVILADKPNRGRTLLEKFEAVGSGAGYAIVLLTKDDLGRAKDKTADQPRARQNVVWEFGFFAGAIGRSHVAVIYEEGVELPSDLHGLVYIPYDAGGGWRLKLARELKDVGVNIDTSKLI